MKLPHVAERIAGADIEQHKLEDCGKCTAQLLVGLVRDGDGTLRWHNFDRKYLDRGGLRVYLRHHCRL